MVTIEIRAVAGLTIPLVDPSFTPDGAASAVQDGTTDTNAPLLDTFPYLGLPGRWLPDRAGHDEGRVMTADTMSDSTACAGLTENPHAGQGCVLLDIGGDVGALVVTAPASMVGHEVEIAPEGVHFGHSDDHRHRPHVAVVRRPVAGGEVPSLVFPSSTPGATPSPRRARPTCASRSRSVVAR